MAVARAISCLTGVLCLVLASAPLSTAQTKKIVDHGKDNDKLVIVVLGDGYTAGEAATFSADVNSMFVAGVLTHDFYRDHQTAFNVYRVTLASKESGVSTPTKAKDTALKTIYNGDWNQCWISESGDTDALLTSALSGVSKYDLIVILQNENGFGGCRRGDRLYVTRGAGWDVAAHEYGHGIGGLLDEYTAGGGAWSGGVLNRMNCSTELNRTTVVWKDLIAATTTLPTPAGSGVVGMYPGCNYKSSGIYRPTERCRMISNTPVFCSVCLRIMVAAVLPYEGGVPASPTKLRIVKAAVMSRPAMSPAADSSMAQSAPTATVRLRVRVTRDGEATVLDAREVPGAITLSDQARSPVVYELSRRGTPFMVQSLPDDPFVAHSYAPPGQSPPHRNVQVNNAEIMVTIPRTTLRSLADDAVDLNLYRIDESRLGQTIDIRLLAQLKSQRAVQTLVTVSSARFQSAIRARLNIR